MPRPTFHSQHRLAWPLCQDDAVNSRRVGLKGLRLYPFESGGEGLKTQKLDLGRVPKRGAMGSGLSEARWLFVSAGVYAAFNQIEGAKREMEEEPKCKCKMN